MTASKPIDRAKLLARSTAPATKGEHAGKTYDVITVPDRQLQRVALYFPSDKVLLAGPEEGVKLALTVLAGNKPSGLLDDAVKRSREKHLLVLGANLQELPGEGRQLAAGAPGTVQPLLEAKAVTLLVDGDNELNLELVLNYSTADKARSASETVASLKAEGKKQLDAAKSAAAASPMGQSFGDLITQMDRTLDSIKSKQSGANVSVTLAVNAKAIGDAMAPMMGQVAAGGPMPRRGAGPVPPMPPRPTPARGGLGNVINSPKRAQNQNNLKQIVLAFLMYADAHGGQLPPAVIYSKDGKTPLYSWRVELLPYLDAGPLYNAFHKDEPWDSPHNKTLLARMPKVFAFQGLQEGTTCYQVFVGPGTPWSGDGRAGPRFPASFTDGTSNTILVAEAAQPVEWTRPADLVMAPGQEAKALLGSATQNDKCFVGMADGSVRTIVLSAISEQTLRNAINPSDGNPLGPDFGN
jgi:hypothetical protein